MDWKPFMDASNGADDYGLELNAYGDSEHVNPYEDICVFWDNLDSYADHYKFYENDFEL